MKIYLSGKITGNPDFAEQFADAEEKAKAAYYGAAVLNPAIMPSGMGQSDYMRISMAMLDCSDMVFMLPNWKESEGARVENAYAEKVGKKIVYLI